MATYKVLQDIEAEDKLLGPLSLRQFIYAVVVVVMGFIAFKLITVKWFLAIPFLPPMIFFGLLAAPFGRDQPSEVWLLAKIRFVLKTRRRIWDQSGVKELVTITVPKTIERAYTKGFSKQEVNSRLKALATTLDTRGWAVKNIDVATFQQPLLVTGATSDRLVDISNLPQQVDTVSIDPSEDILDEENNPVAQNVSQTLTESTQIHREQLLKKVRAVAEKEKFQKKLITISPEEQAILDKIQNQYKAQNAAQANMRHLDPTQSSNTQPVQPVAQPIQNQVQAQAQTPVTQVSDPGILKLVKSNDLNVSTIAREANKKNDSEPPEDEVVISLR